jgi:hypothetical protein
MPGAVSSPGPWRASASRSKHGFPSDILGKIPVLKVVEVFSESPRGSIPISTESVRQCRLQSSAPSTVPCLSSRTLTSTCSALSVQVTLPVAEQSSADSHAEPSQRRDRFSSGPGYSPGDSLPSTAGAVDAFGSSAAGTSSRAPFCTSVSPAEEVVVMVRS